MGNFPSFPGLPLPSSSSATVRTTTIGTCPPVTLTTQTVYTEVTAANIRTTTLPSATSTVYPSTVTLPTTYTVIQGVYQSTTTVTTTTSTEVIFTVIPATATTTKPTPSGFTPVRCDKAYFNPTTTITITNSASVEIRSTVTTTANTPATMYSVPIYTTITNTIPGVSTATYRPTVTSSSTRNEPTTTLYDACATNNIVAAAPSASGQYILEVYAKYERTDALPYPAVDAGDCCGRCQARDDCTGSVWYPGRPQPCVHLVKQASAPAACDPRTIGGLAQNTNENIQLYISNGRCGQFTFDQINFGNS